MDSPRALHSADRRIRVLQVIGTMHIGGAENVVAGLVRGLDRNKFTLRVCCTKARGVVAEQLAQERVDVTLAAPPGRVLRHLTPFYLSAEISDFKPDLVHTHGTPSLLHMAPVALMGRAPRWVHTFHYGRYDNAVGKQFVLEGRFCPLATQLVSVSESQRQAIVARYSLSPDRVLNIPNGVPYVAPSAEQLSGLRSEFGLTESDLVIGCVAVLSEQKGVSHLLRAASALVSQFANLKILVVGGGPLEGALRAEAQALGLASRAIFTGWRMDATRFLPLFDVWVMASLWEAMPLALIEAMASGRAIVVSDVSDNRRIVGDRSAIVVPPANASAIEAAVAELLNSAARRYELGAAAAASFTEHYTTARMVADYERLYQCWPPPR